MTGRSSIPETVRVCTRRHGVLDAPLEAGHDDRETRLRLLAARCARDLQEFRPSRTEGVGNAGCPMHPQPRVRILVASMHTSIHSGRNGSPGIPARSGFNGFLRALPGDRACLSPSPANSIRKLDASVGASGPHDFAVRLSAVRQRRRHVHRIPPRVRDDRDTPLQGDETAVNLEVIWVFRKSEYFCKTGWTLTDTGISELPDGQIRRLARAGLSAGRAGVATRHAKVPIRWTHFTSGIGEMY